MSNKSKINLPAFAAAIERVRGHQGPPEKPVSFDDRKPFSPDRPGLYELRNGEAVTILGHHFEGSCWWRASYGAIFSSDGSFLGNGKKHPRDIIAIAPGDAAWCLAQARLLCPKGYVVVPVEPTEAMQEAGCAAHDAYGLNPKWETDHRPMTASAYRAMIASAVEGK